MSFYNGILNHDEGSENIRGARGSPGIGFKLDSNNDYDMQNKKLVNVKNGVNSDDAITKSQLDTKTSLLDGARTHGYIVNNKAVIYSQSGAVHAKSFYLQDQNEDEVRILTDNQDYDNVHLFVPNLKNFDGFDGRKRSEIMVTSVDQTISGNKFFQNIKAPNPTEDGDVANKDYVDFKITKQNALINNTFVKKTGDVLTGDLILPHDNYPVQGNTNKAVSYETQREIFLSRKESFPMQADINMNNNFIQNVATPTTSHQGANKGYCDYNFLNRQKGGRIMGSLSMNQNDLFEIPDTPKFGSSAVNKSYVEGEIAKIPQGSNSDTSSFLKLDGSRAMSGDLNMNSNNIVNVGINLSDDTTAVPRSYVDSFVNSAIHNPLDEDLYANNHQIKNLKTPSEDNDAVTKKYFEDQLLNSHLLPSHKDNAFKYLLDADESSSERNIIVNGIVDFNESPHSNKKAYSVDMIYIPGTQNYDSRIGINIFSLPIGKFTIIMEYYYPDNINIAVSCQASSAIINNQFSKNFTNYIKLFVQFEDKAKQIPDYLYFDISGSGTTSTNPEGYLVFYGMKEWMTSVPPEIYDHVYELSFFELKSGFMRMNVDIDMNQYRISNLSNAINGKDAINKNQYDALKTQLDAVEANLKHYKLSFKNNGYIQKFESNFYDLKEPFSYNLASQYLVGIKNMINSTKGLSFTSAGGLLTLHDLDPIKGLQLNDNIIIYIDIGNVDQRTPYTIFRSMILKDDISFYFIDSNNVPHYPGYVVGHEPPKLYFQSSANSQAELKINK